MYAFRLRAAAVALVAGIGLAGCTTPYGSGVSVGVGNGGYYDPYYGGYGYGGYPAYGAGYGYGSGYPGYGYGVGYPGYGYGYGYAPYYGWNNGFYYPGSGYYVYDVNRNPHRWTDEQRRYWEARRKQAVSSDEFRRQIESQAQNWSGFEAGPNAVTQQVQTRDGQRVRVQRERPVRGDRANRTQRVRQVNQTEGIQQVERAQRAERGNRAERIERVRPERAQRIERQSSREFRSSMSGRSRADGNGESNTKED